jgi:hypothetical protein
MARPLRRRLKAIGRYIADLENLRQVVAARAEERLLEAIPRLRRSRQTAPLYHPRQRTRTEHFAWNEDYSRVIGLTPTGRATVETLHLNRPGVVNLRRVLFFVGMHPPEESEIVGE